MTATNTKPNFVYISGPITGHASYREAFEGAQRDLSDQGILSFNPAHVEIPGASWEEYMRHDIAMLLKCDAIFLLPGWTTSRGACLEYHIAQQLGMTIVEGSAKE